MKRRLLGDIVHGFRQMANIPRGNSSHWDAAVLNNVKNNIKEFQFHFCYLCQIYRVVLDDIPHLLGCHAGEAEHSNLGCCVQNLERRRNWDLVGDVLPVVGASFLGETLFQGCPHTNDPEYHRLIYVVAYQVMSNADSWCTLHSPISSSCTCLPWSSHPSSILPSGQGLSSPEEAKFKRRITCFGLE